MKLFIDYFRRVYYEMPSVSYNRAHKSVLLEGCKLPKPALSPGEAESVRRTNERNGGRGGYRGRGGGGRGGGRGGYDNNRNDNGGGGRGGYNNNNQGGGYNNNNNNQGGGYNNGGNYGGQQPNFPPSPFPAWPPQAGGQNFLPPPPPGWVPPPNIAGGWQGAPQGGYGGPPPMAQRPAWMGNPNHQQHSGPPPRGPPGNNSLRDERFYRPADEILGRNGGGGYQANNSYNDRQPRDDMGGRGGGSGGNRGGRGGGRGGGGGYQNSRPTYNSNEYR